MYLYRARFLACIFHVSKEIRGISRESINETGTVLIKITINN